MKIIKIFLLSLNILITKKNKTMNLIKEYQELLDYGVEMNGTGGTYEGENFSFDYKVVDTQVYISNLLNDSNVCPFTDLEVSMLESSLNGVEDDGESLEDFEDRTHYTL
tara:strand:+ start:110 stop:436 length:327 start_codon:yes stop_codon:yes gene_type:complete